MSKLAITGGISLNGEIKISGSKNSVLPILTATLLSNDVVTISNVPHLHDVTTIMELLAQLGVKLTVDKPCIFISSLNCALNPCKTLTPSIIKSYTFQESSLATNL